MKRSSDQTMRDGLAAMGFVADGGPGTLRKGPLTVKIDEANVWADLSLDGSAARVLSIRRPADVFQAAMQLTRDKAVNDTNAQWREAAKGLKDLL